MVRLFSWCIVIGCCLCASQASATEDKALRGPGVRTCGEFAFDYRVNLNTENTYFDWAEGFMSGMNRTDVMNDHTAKKHHGIVDSGSKTSNSQLLQRASTCPVLGSCD